MLPRRQYCSHIVNTWWCAVAAVFVCHSLCLRFVISNLCVRWDVGELVVRQQGRLGWAFWVICRTTSKTHAAAHVENCRSAAGQDICLIVVKNEDRGSKLPEWLPSEPCQILSSDFYSKAILDLHSLPKWNVEIRDVKWLSRWCLIVKLANHKIKSWPIPSFPRLHHWNTDSKGKQRS